VLEHAADVGALRGTSPCHAPEHGPTDAELRALAPIEPRYSRFSLPAVAVLGWPAQAVHRSPCGIDFVPIEKQLT
jgi:hypothetical protein